MDTTPPKSPSQSSNPGGLPGTRPASAPVPPLLSCEDVRKVALLARLEIREDEVGGFRERLGAVLGYVERLRGLDLAGVEPLAHVGEETHRLRADEPGATLGTERLMSMAPEAMPPFVKVPKVLGEGGGA